MEKEFPVTVLHSNFTGFEMPIQLNGLFNSDGTRESLERKIYQSIDMVLPFICPFVTRITAYIEIWEQRRANGLCFELVV